MYPQFYSGGTESTNHVVFQTLPVFFSESSDYSIVAQDAVEAQSIENVPAASMGAFVMAVGEMKILRTISIDTRDGDDRKHARLLSTNAAALRVWKTRGMHPRQIGIQHRPPHSAVLAFGVPFGE